MEGTAGQQRCAALLLAPQFEEAIDAPGVHVRPWLPGAPVTDTHATTPRAQERRRGGWNFTLNYHQTSCLSAHII